MLRKNWKWLAAGLAALIVVVVLVFSFRLAGFVEATTGGGRTSLFQPTLEPTATVSSAKTSNSTAAPNSTPTPLNLSGVAAKIKNGTPVTVLLAGYGGDGHAGEWITDTILFMRFDPKTKTLLQMNIPRDLYVFIPFGGQNNGKWDKVNMALPTIMEWSKPTQDSLDPRYRWGDNTKKKFDAGINLLADTVEPVIGYPIDYWATLSFEGFRRFIDAMGGVEVNVENSFIDRKYPRNDNDQIDAGVITVQFKAGLQKMNGDTAIRYARSRYSEDLIEQGDFARSKRQMNLLNAVKTKALKENLIMKSLDYMQALEGQLRFSLDFGDLVGLANYFNSTEGKALATDTKMLPAILNDYFLIDKTVDGTYYLYPVEGQGKYAAIQRWLKRIVTNTENKNDVINLQVLNCNGATGVAGTLTDKLLAKGFKMAQEQDGENRDDTVLLDYSQGKGDSTITRLKTVFPALKVLTLAPDKKPKNAPADTDLQLCLGKDFKMISG